MLYYWPAGCWHNFLSGHMIKSPMAMQPVITLFKTESLKLSELYDQLGILPHEAKECEFFYTYSPPPGMLFKVLDVLKRNNVNHGIRFETAKPSRSKKAGKNLKPELARL
jgi:hypothetical protein